MRSKFRSSVLLLAVSTLLAISAQAQSAKDDPSTLFQDFRVVIKKIMNGEDDGALRKAIHPEAYIVHGARFESLFEVLGKKARTRLFNHDEASTMNMLKGWMNDAKDIAYLVVKSGGIRNEAARFQTVVFVRSNARGWQLTHWHAGA